MPLLSKFERQREITRDRPRPVGAPNFITLKRGAIYYKIEYALTPQYAITFAPYEHPTTHPLGYVFAPPPEPPLVPVGPVTSPQGTYVPTIPIEIPLPPAFPITPIAPPPLPSIAPLPPTAPAPSLSVLVPNTFVGFMTLTLSDSVTPLASSPLKVREFTLFADPGNANPIHIGKSGVTIDSAYLPLFPGASVTFFLDDLSKIVVKGPGKLYVFYMA